MKKIKFLGIDGWGRAVYKDADNLLWKTCKPVYDYLINNSAYINAIGLYDSSNNDFEGEPGFHLKEVIDIIIEW